MAAALVAGVAAIGSGGGPAGFAPAHLAAEDTLEQMLPESRQHQPLRYELLRQNNNCIFLGIPTGASNQLTYTLTVKEVFKTGESGRTIKADETIDVQNYRGLLRADTPYLLPVYIWGNNNPAVCQAGAIALKRDYQNDPLYKVLRFTLDNNQPNDPEVFTALVWKLYQSIPQDDILEDARLELLAYLSAERSDRIDPKNADFAAEIDRVLHKELLGDADRLRKVEKGDPDQQFRMERALEATSKLYLVRGNVPAGDELAKLLEATPLAIAAGYALAEKCTDQDRGAAVEKILPRLEELLKKREVSRDAIRLLYMVRQLKDAKLLDPIKQAITADKSRPDVLILARTLLAAQGEEAWEAVSPVLDRQYDWQNNNMFVQSDLIRLALEKIGKKAYPQLVKTIKKNQQMQNMIYQVLNGVPAESREEFGLLLLDAGVHNTLSFLLQGNTAVDARLIDYVLRYAVGEISANDDLERNMLVAATVNARQYLKNLLNCDIATRAAFNEWYLDKMHTIDLPLSANLKAKLPDWQRDLASPQGEVRAQAQKQLHDLGTDALPALLALEKTTRDLTTRQTARAMILQLPIAAEAFATGQ